jgi:hypothetical protein
VDVPARTRAEEDRAFVVSRRFGRVAVRIMVAAIVLGTVASLVLRDLTRDAPALLHVALTTAVFAAAILLAWVVVVRGRTKAAWESFAWLGRWDVDRLERLTGARAPDSEDALRLWLTQHDGSGDDRLARVEVLGSLGQTEEARTLLAAAPATDDPWIRFERRAMLAWLDWLDGGRLDLAAVRDAAAAIAPGEDRTRAEVVMALADSRGRAAAGDKTWMEPLVEVRPRLGDEPAKILRRDFLWRMLRIGVATGLILGGLLELLA